jgi:murein L,D-transpeptidase YcbB/YkuD
MFWKSVNVPVEDRIQQIKVTLARWRESGIGNDDYFVLVNIPDFHAEVWRGGKRDMRFRIVAGNTQWGCDRKKKIWTRVNATPLQSNAIRNVILNPYWNIPERIWKEELVPEKKEKPDLFEEKGYECVQVGDEECGRLRQKSGGGNALGRVKFIFPNEWNTYMHDTPKKNFFTFPIRAFSHGCMRVQDPLDFAEYLLKTDGSYDEKSFKKTLDGDIENNLRLKAPVPIHIEYYTVRVDDDGRLNFLADIYRYDQDRINGVEASHKKCEPAAYEEDEDDGALDDGLSTDGASPSGDGAAGTDGAPVENKVEPTGAVPAPEGGAVFRAIGRKPTDGPTDEPTSTPANP